MISAPGTPDPPVARLLAGTSGPAPTDTLVLSTGTSPAPAALDLLLAEWAAKPRARVLVLGTVGTHRDARAARLRALWTIEEQARASGLSVLALRLGPLVGPRSPLWLRLRSGAPAPRTGSALLQPVAEADVVATIGRALTEEGDWAGWYDVVGPEPLTMAELAELAGRDAALPREAGAWEPPLDELAEQGLHDGRPWAERYGITPRRVSEESVAWA